LIVLLQLTALAYGLYTVVAARPVFLAFERDRFRVVSAAEIDRVDLSKALPEFRSLSFYGPRLIGVRVPKPGDPDYLRSIELSLNGLEPSLRPSLWQRYEEQHELLKNRLQSISQIKNKQPESLPLIDAAISKLHMSEASIGYLPMVGRAGSGWIALVSRNDFRVLGFVEVDGF
jgi:hypothetical protein